MTTIAKWMFPFVAGACIATGCSDEDNRYNTDYQWLAIKEARDAWDGSSCNKKIVLEEEQTSDTVIYISASLYQNQPAPADCTVSVLYPTLHAIGLKLADDTELLIHIGMDTVAMNGDGFTKHVNEGDSIKKGTPIVSFDIDKIKAAGHDTTVSVLISNTGDFASVEGIPAEHADLGQVVIKAVK